MQPYHAAGGPGMHNQVLLGLPNIPLLPTAHLGLLQAGDLDRHHY